MFSEDGIVKPSQDNKNFVAEIQNLKKEIAQYLSAEIPDLKKELAQLRSELETLKKQKSTTNET